MKRNSFIIAGILLLIMSFQKLEAQSRTYNIFYVDNSYSKSHANFGQELFGILGDKVDSINNNDSRFSAIVFFVANGQKQPLFASNYRGAKNYIDRLAENAADAPNSFADRSNIIENLLTTDLSGIRAVKINLFLSEGSLLNDFIQGNAPGIFINFLPKEIGVLMSCQEDNIKVSIYYPADSKKIDQQTLKSFVGFPASHPDFTSKIKFEFIPV